MNDIPLFWGSIVVHYAQKKKRKKQKKKRELLLQKIDEQLSGESKTKILAMTQKNKERKYYILII